MKNHQNWSYLIFVLLQCFVIIASNLFKMFSLSFPLIVIFNIEIVRSLSAITKVLLVTVLCAAGRNNNYKQQHRL